MFRHQAIHAFAFPSADDLTMVHGDADASMCMHRCYLCSEAVGGSHFHVMTLVNDSIVDMLGQ